MPRRAVQESAPTRVLMHPPEYYLIPASENNWMDVNNQPDREEKWLQWIVIRNSYERFGLKVFEMEPRPRFWDMIFTANGAWGKDREFVLANFRQPIRQAESEHFKRWLERLDCKVFELPREIFFEGQGDVITLKDTYLFGWGPRSSQEASGYVHRLLALNKPVTPLHLVSRFYHLDTCCMSLRGTKGVEGLVYYPGAFDEDSLHLLRDLPETLPGGIVRKKFEVSEKLAECFVCNSVFVRDVVLLNVPIPYEDYSDDAFTLSASGVLMESEDDPRYREMIEYEPDYVGLIEFLRELGYKILPVYTSEYKKSGAGVRCTTLFLNE